MQFWLVESEKARTLKDKFNIGNYICLHKIHIEQENADRWVIISNPTFENNEDKYRLIHIKDEKIIKAVLEQDDVEIEIEMSFRDGEKSMTYQDWENLAIPFIEHYAEHVNYRLKTNSIN